MATPFFRKYKCKDSDLPVICNIAADSLESDLADFSAYSPKFSQTRLIDFRTYIEKVFEIVLPQAEIQLQKVITERMNGTLDSMTDAANRLSGYIKFSHTDHTDFGITLLRKAINDGDAEGGIKSLQTVIVNIANFKEALVQQGLTEELISVFATAREALKVDKAEQTKIFNNRKRIVQNNLGLLNGLFDQLNEILIAGKILYKATDPAKLQEYTFEDLKKRVRRASKPGKKVSKDKGEDPAATDEK